MKVLIGEKEFEFEVHGTVGLVFMVEEMTGKDFDFASKRDIMYLTYAVLVASNKGKEITLDWYLENLTSPPFIQMRDYIYKRWAELEPKPEEEEKNDEGEVKNA